MKNIKKYDTISWKTLKNMTQYHEKKNIKKYDTKSGKTLKNMTQNQEKM